MKCVERTATVRDRSVDLLWKSVVVGESKAELGLCQVGFLEHAVNRVKVLISTDDFPDVQGRADDPGPPFPVGATEGNAGKEPTAQGLFCQGLDNDCLGAARPPGFFGHERIQGG